MHKFTRGMPPVDMAKTKKKYHNQWDKTFIDSNEHAVISDCLYGRQDHYCAYCDTKINVQKDGHVEHLERRANNPQRRFDWNNMFFSCNKDDSCGNFKDNSKPAPVFNPMDIVDPSIEDPDDFFVYDLEGNILPKDADHAHKAKETIRIFNLNNARLTGIRSGLAVTITGILEYNPSEQELDAVLSSLIDICPSVCYSLLRKKRA